MFIAAATPDPGRPRVEFDLRQANKQKLRKREWREEAELGIKKIRAKAFNVTVL